MKMARKAGAEHVANGYYMISEDELIKNANAILERAAEQCTQHGHEEDRPSDYAYRIRALKINTGD